MTKYSGQITYLTLLDSRGLPDTDRVVRIRDSDVSYSSASELELELESEQVR